MSEHHFWLPDDPFDRLKPLSPNKGRGVPRVDDRKVISGIIHVIRYGLMWRDAPACYGPHKTLYNRFVQLDRAGVFDRIFQALAAESTATKTVMIDSTHLKAHRTAASLLKGGSPTPDRTHPGWAELEAPRRLRWQARRAAVDGGGRSATTAGLIRYLRPSRKPMS